MQQGDFLVESKYAELSIVLSSLDTREGTLAKFDHKCFGAAPWAASS